NVLMEASEGGRGDPHIVPGPGLFAPPERIDARPFSAIEAAKSILDTAIEVLRARGEPARYERLLGEILVGLDRSGQLRRLVGSESRSRGGSLDRPPIHQPEVGDGGESDDSHGSGSGRALPQDGPPASFRAPGGSHARASHDPAPETGPARATGPRVRT